jgi:hypothetical protein
MIREQEMHTTFWFEDFRGKGHKIDIGTCSRVMLKIIFKKYVVKVVKWMIPAPDRFCW